MSVAAGASLKQTALNTSHREARAKMVDYCGWDMPVEYSGIIREHVAVRTSAGLFDVSHMGEIDVRGPRALALLEYVTCNDVSALQDGQAQYSALMLPNGACIDDCVIHRFSPEHYFICVNAGNTDRDYDWIVECNTFGADVQNVSAEYSQIALQGPKSVEILKKIAGSDPSTLKYYRFRQETVAGIKGILARTGYTGEDGFEFYFPPASSEHLWNAILDAGKNEGLIPAGLGARNTLRLEAGYPLYGHELDSETTLIEANLGWIVKLAKGEFIGSDVLSRQKSEGAPKKLIGFEMVDPAPARDDYPVSIDGKIVGKVTSGSPSPFLKKNIGLAYAPTEFAEAGREIEIQVRARQAKARIVPLPFYKRLKK